LNFNYPQTHQSGNNNALPTEILRRSHSSLFVTLFLNKQKEQKKTFVVDEENIENAFYSWKNSDGCECKDGIKDCLTFAILICADSLKS
jgi:hypothetical protein